MNPNSPPPVARPQRVDAKRWRLLAVSWLILLINFSFPMYGAGVINGYMLTDLHLDRGVLGLGFTIFLLVTGLPGPAVAWLMNRLGTRTTLTCGNLLVLVGSVLMATVVTNGLAAAIVFGLVIGAGVISGGILGTQTLVARWFEERRARAIAILLTAIGLGGFIAPPLFNSVIAATGAWQSGWWLMALLAAVAAALAAFEVRDDPPAIAPAQHELNAEVVVRDPSAAPVEWSYRQAIGTRAFWTICYCATCFTAVLAFFVSHVVVYLRSIGTSPASAALAVAFMSLASLVAKLLIGLIGARLEIRVIWCLGFLAMGAGILMIPSGINIGPVPLFAPLCGLGIGVSLVAVSTLLVNLFGVRSFPLLMGLVLTVQTIVSGAVPLAAGALFDATGSYTPILWAIALMCGGAFVALIALKVPSAASQG